MLDSYRVLDLTDGGALIGGQMLGDLGADVIVVEPPGGAAARRIGPYYRGDQDPERSLYWWALNRNKRGITLDIESPEGQQQLKELVKSADFLLESFGPGYMDRLGLGYAELAELNPALIMASISAFGGEGPKAHWANSDITAFASSGVMNITGDEDRPPVAISVPQAFMHAGAEAASGALIAHHGRLRDGLGQHIDVSAQTATMMATQGTALSYGWGEMPASRIGGGINFGGIPVRFVHPAADGYVSVVFLFGSALGPFTRRLMEVMHEEGFVDDATRDKDWLNYTTLILSGEEPVDEVIRCTEAIAAFTRSHTKDELFKIAMERDILLVPVANMEDVAKSEQLAARHFWRQLEHPEIGETVTYPGHAVKTDKPLIEYRRRAPLIGEHNNEVFAEQRAPAAYPPPTTGARDLPLKGVKVLDFAWVVATPWGSRYFADYGATVIKVENTAHVDMLRTTGPFKDHEPGPERSAAFATVNAGKLGLTLNLASAEGRELAKRLAAWADVVTESFAPGMMKRFGLDYESLKEVNPDLIMISSCLNGQTGPHAGLAGIGTMGMQLAGFGDLAGWPDRPPAGPAGAYTDYIAPKVICTAVLAALAERNRTGEGLYIDFSQAEGSQQFLAPALLDYFVNGHVLERRGNSSPDHAPHGVYPVAGEDRWVAIAAITDSQWQGLCRAMGRDDWAENGALAGVDGRLARATELDEGIAAWTASRDADAVEQALQAEGVPVHRVSKSEDLWSDPQIEARGHFVEVEHPEYGQVRVENSRMIFSGTPANVTRPGPTFGQDNEHILKDLLGCSDEEFIEYLAAGALE